MEINIEYYKKCVRQLIQEYADRMSAAEGINREIIFDEERARYALFIVGWKKYKRIHICNIHIDIIDGKVWIQHNGPEEILAEELVKMGIPKEQIVNAFQHPYKRELTEYAVS